MSTSANSITLPPIAILDAAAAELIRTISPNASVERALNKALWNLQSGIEIRSTCGGFLIQSSTRTGIIHRVNTVHGCDCEAAGKGHTCWHVQAIRILEEAQRHTMPAMPLGERIAAAAQLADKVITIVDETRLARKIAAARATAQLNELFA